MVKWTWNLSREAEEEYEIPDAILKPSESEQATETMATTNMYKAVDTINPAAPEYATTDEAVRGITHCSSWIDLFFQLFQGVTELCITQ